MSGSTFVVGRGYTREEIHATVGGGLQESFPALKNRVVCVCLTRGDNPDAPEIVLVGGKGTRVETNARILAGQTDRIPVFMKAVPNDWRYLGDYRVARSTEDPAEVRSWADRSSRKDKAAVWMVLFLEK